MGRVHAWFLSLFPLLFGIVLLLPLAALGAAFFLDVTLPAEDALEVIATLMMIAGLYLVGKRRVIRVRRKDGVLYLVQLGGSGVRTINFYYRHADARELAHTLAEILRLPVREV